MKKNKENKYVVVDALVGGEKEKECQQSRKVSCYVCYALVDSFAYFLYILEAATAAAASDYTITTAQEPPEVQQRNKETNKEESTPAHQQRQVNHNERNAHAHTHSERRGYN